MSAAVCALPTGFYPLTMRRAYFAHGMHDTAIFELFVRRLPPSRNFLVCAGIGQALDYLEALRFTPGELAWVRAEPRPGPQLAESLAGSRADLERLPDAMRGVEPASRPHAVHIAPVRRRRC